jgi:citronellol/citronellal dehydrogenase
MSGETGTPKRPPKEVLAAEFSDEALFAHPKSFADGLLDGKVVLLTGAGGGIGRAVAWLVGRLGATVIIAGRKQEKLDVLSAAMRSKGLKVHSHLAEMRERDQVDALVDFAWTTGGGVDLVIHSAGGQFPQAAIDFSLKGWKAVIDTNLTGTFNLMQASARRWRDAGRGGNIVNIVTSPRNLHHVSHSNAARSGIIAFSEAVAVEWAPLGIRVNCVAPGVIRSEGFAAYEPQVRARYKDSNPLRRMGTPWDIAEACVYLGGPSGQFITGANLEVNGGGSLWGEVWTTDKPDYFLEASRATDPANVAREKEDDGDG